MNNKSGSEGGDVVEQFNAFIKKWCGDSYPHLIDSDENDGERFRDNIRDLQKLCEEQKGELAELKHRSEVCQKFHGESFSMDRHVELMEAHEKSLSQLAHLNLVLEGYKVMAGLSTTDHLKVQRMIQKELEKQRMEIERLMGDFSAIYAQQHKYLSQLATQTERVRKMTRALMLVDEVWTRANLYPEINHLGDDEHEAWGLVKQALKQENLGNGGKGEEELSMLYTRLAQVDLSRPSARDLRLGSQLHGITQNQDLRALRI